MRREERVSEPFEVAASTGPRASSRQLGRLSLLSLGAGPSAASWATAQATSGTTRVLSPMGSLLAASRIVEGVTAGAVLRRDGSTETVRGLEAHALLRTDSPVLEIARWTSLSGRVHRSFLWPAGTPPTGPDGYVRVSVIATGRLSPVVSAAVLVAPRADCRSLTRRELEVLGLLVDGCTNQQIASRLGVRPRTVAAHLEHVLDKLDAPSRTVAALRADRDGCYIPPRPASRSWSSTAPEQPGEWTPPTSTWAPGCATTLWAEPGTRN